MVDWSDAAAQRRRFAVLAGAVDLSGRSLLDVGCGLGDLWAYLCERGIDAAYTGVDLSEAMVAAAARAHPDARFVCRDVFAGPPADAPTHDVVFCSGAMNLDLHNNVDFLPHALRRLLALARGHMVFNLLHVRAPAKCAYCFYHDPADVLAVLAALPCRARLIDDYLPNDFTVICEVAPGAGR